MEGQSISDGAANAQLYDEPQINNQELKVGAQFRLKQMGKHLCSFTFSNDNGNLNWLGSNQMFPLICSILVS